MIKSKIIRIFYLIIFFGIWFLNYNNLIYKLLPLDKKQMKIILENGKLFNLLKLFDYLSLDFLFSIFMVLMFVFLYYLFVKSQISIKAKERGKFKQFDFSSLELKLEYIRSYIFCMLCFAAWSLLAVKRLFVSCEISPLDKFFNRK